jgi:hypothetical protein
MDIYKTTQEADFAWEWIGRFFRLLEKSPAKENLLILPF